MENIKTFVNVVKKFLSLKLCRPGQLPLPPPPNPALISIEIIITVDFKVKENIIERSKGFQ